MDIFNLLTLIGGLSLFLFGMTIMGQALERRAGGELRSLLGKFTTNKMAGLLTGAGVTTVIQSSQFSDKKSVDGCACRSTCYGGSAEQFGDDGYGSGLCKLRADVAAAGDQCNYGCEYRHYHYSMDTQSERNRKHHLYFETA